MRPPRDPTRLHLLLLSALDRLGRPIEPCVLSVAQEIAPQAVTYAQKFLADPCVAMNLLEEAAATVSVAARAKEAADLPPIRDLRAYLYRTFLRRVSSQREAEMRLEEAFEDHFRLNKGMSFEKKLEARLLLKQIFCMCDRKTMWIIWERIEGRSWDELAYDLVMSNHAARLHCSRALRKIREAFETDPRAYMERLLQADHGRQRKAHLIMRLKTLFLLRLFRAVRAKSVFGGWFHASYHERQDMLAELDSMFS